MFTHTFLSVGTLQLGSESLMIFGHPLLHTFLYAFPFNCVHKFFGVFFNQVLMILTTN